MTDTNIVELSTPENPLNALLKQGAQALLMKAVEAELQVLLDKCGEQEGGKNRVVRNGYLPERTIQTGGCNALPMSKAKYTCYGDSACLS